MHHSFYISQICSLAIIADAENREAGFRKRPVSDAHLLRKNMLSDQKLSNFAAVGNLRHDKTKYPQL